MKYLVGLVALLAGLAFGNWFPDIDQKTGLLLHRSIISHGPLFPLILFAVASTTRPIQLRWFAMGVTLGMAVHLSFDLFPKGWSGFSLISLPVYGRTTPWFSWIWIAASTVGCTYLAKKLVRSTLDGSLFVLSLIFGFGYIVMSEDAVWRPFGALTVAIAVALTPTIRRVMSED